MVAPSASPLNVPLTASVPSLSMILNVVVRAGTKLLINDRFNAPLSVTVPFTSS